MHARGRPTNRWLLRERRLSASARAMSLALFLLRLPGASAINGAEEEPQAHPDAESPKGESPPAPEETFPDDALPRPDDPKPVPVEEDTGRAQRAFGS
ncbi:hypothetical protein [Methylacidimicrobium sp. B4]|uniref:hypothetical protein n=1 Tax=Methylacidimicrobium sp. B4 TaxID=2796139 RepID=UPI001A8D4E81|nr:hypothetical protein [Methylacidimicrobium sp. B4]QSR84342.1 hypothetical protein MacB4_08965 [Methylacidimicrobium sp. B4]